MAGMGGHDMAAIESQLNQLTPLKSSEKQEL